MIKSRLNITMDLGCCSIETAIEQFKDDFGFLSECNWLNIFICIEDIFGAIEIKQYLKKLEKKYNIKLAMQVDRSLEKDCWRIQGIKDNQIYMIYSLGA